MNPYDLRISNHTRRQLLARSAGALGSLALGGALVGGSSLRLNGGDVGAVLSPGAPGPHFPGKAKHVIYLHMVGGPSQMDLFDYKPGIKDWYDKDLPPASVRNGQRLTTMSSGPGALPDRALEVHLPAARPVRHVDERAAAQHGQVRGRHLLHPLAAHRCHQP
jgi:hypothetical protein